MKVNSCLNVESTEHPVQQIIKYYYYTQEW